MTLNKNESESNFAKGSGKVTLCSWIWVDCVKRSACGWVEVEGVIVEWLWCGCDLYQSTVSASPLFLFTSEDAIN